MPLVLNFHGATSNAAQQEAYTSFSPKADAEGFIVVYPQGVTTSAYSFTHFNAWQLSSPEPDDVAFTNQLLDTLQSQLCIDTNRVFSTGLSNGAMMSVRLACSLSNRIAAIAPVAGAYYPPLALDLNAAETCPDTRPVPVIAFHGTSDTIVPYNGGPGGIPGFMITFRLPIDDNTSAEDVMADWSAHNGCTSGRMESNVSTQVDKITYDTCGGGATVELYRVNGGGHTWPDAPDVPSLGKTTHEINATNFIWTFFQAHPLGPPKAAAVGGVAGLPEVAASPVEAVGGSRSHKGFVIGAASGLATAGGLGGAAWWLRRRRS